MQKLLTRPLRNTPALNPLPEGRGLVRGVDKFGYNQKLGGVV
ncbi:hypothetical protein [Desulfurella amilsii]|nr:hypothetical protein [Desulfurella amilsii]